MRMIFPSQVSRSFATGLAAASALLLCSCMEPVTDAEALESATSSSQTNPAATKPSQRLDKHDIALRFLTAYIRLDREVALQYATPEAVAALNWSRPHGANVPYYDDKMILHYSGGWARVYFQQVDGSYQISKIEAHDR